MLTSRSLFILALTIATFYTVSSLTDGLLPNGNFEYGPDPSHMKGTVVTSRSAIPKWRIAGYVEYIKSGQKQDDMLLPVPEGAYAVRLGNEALIKQMVRLTKGTYYALTFSAARTCAQEERLNVSVSHGRRTVQSGILPMQTMYSSSGWDSYSWGFLAEGDIVDISIHNPGVEEDAACGPLIDAVALKTLHNPQRTGANLLKNGNFEEGPFVIPKTSWGVLIPPHNEDQHGPLPGWIVESLKAVKYIDSDHFTVPEGKRAIELVAGKEGALAQVVLTRPGKLYVLTFSVGDGKNLCAGSLAVEAYAGHKSVSVPYASKGKGGFIRGRLPFKAVSNHTRIMFLSAYYTMASDNSGSLCGPVIDDVKLISVRARKLGIH